MDGEALLADAFPAMEALDFAFSADWANAGQAARTMAAINRGREEHVLSMAGSSGSRRIGTLLLGVQGRKRYLDGANLSHLGRPRASRADARQRRGVWQWVLCDA